VRQANIRSAIVRSLFLAVCVCTGLWFHSGPALAADLELEPLITEALGANPGLHALQSRMEAFQARIRPAGALEDPVLKFDASNVPLSSFDFNSTPMSGKQIMLSQAIPFPGTLRAKTAVAEHTMRASESDLHDREAAVINLVKQSYFMLGFVDRTIDVLERNEDLLRDFVRIAESKYAVGNGLQQDVLKAQVSLSALQAQLIRLRTERSVAASRLNLVLNRPIDQPVGRSGALTISSFLSDYDSLSARAMVGRPMLQQLAHARRSFEAKERVAQKMGKPMLMFSLGYRQRDFMAFDPVKGSDFLSVGVGISLPIYRGRKQKEMAAEARANVRMTDSRLEAAQQAVRFGVRSLLLVIEEHEQQERLYRTAIVPQAQQSLASAMVGYQVDKVDFLTLLNNQLALLNFEIDADRHVTEHEKKIAELEAVTGVRFNSSSLTH
jgi:cobalt-zinc-cadmium efflux system outer membrane protein